MRDGYLYGQRDGAQGQRNLTVQQMTLRADSIDEEARSVEAVLSTEQPTQVVDMREWRVIDEVLRADGLQIPSQVPLLDSHMRGGVDNVLGSVRNVRVENDQIVGRLFFATHNDRAEQAWEMTRQGHLTDVSVGYRVESYVDIPSGGSETVKGKQYRAGNRKLRITTKWSTREVSLVPIGADDAAKIRQDEAATQQRSDEQERTEIMKKELRKYLESLGLRAEATEAEAWQYFEGLQGDQRVRAEGIKSGTIRPSDGATDGRQDAGDAAGAGNSRQDAGATAGDRPPVADPNTIALEAVRAERQRVAQLRELAGEDIPDAVLQRAIDEGWDVSRASSEFLTHIRQARSQAVHGGFGIRVVDHERDLNRETLGDAVLMRCGIEPEEAERANRAEPYRDMNIIDLARHCCRLDGVTVPHGRDELFARATSTQSFPQLLANVANKALGTAFNEASNTSLRWCGTKSVRDFKTHKHVRLSNTDNLVQVGESGQIEHTELSETYEEYALATYGQRIQFTRKQWINDDLGGLVATPRKMGQAARRLIDDVAYEELLSNPTMNEDSNTLFSASHTNANYISGAATALSHSSLSTAKQKMRKQVGMQGEHLNLMPVYLIVPPELEQTALELTVSSQILLASAGTSDPVTTTVRGSDNVHGGSLTVVVEPRLSAGVNDQSGSTTAWYLATNFDAEEHIAVAFLNGRRVPTIERKDPADVLGLGWWVYFDVAAQALGWRGMVKSKGAA